MKWVLLFYVANAQAVLENYNPAHSQMRFETMEECAERGLLLSRTLGVRGQFMCNTEATLLELQRDMRREAESSRK